MSVMSNIKHIVALSGGKDSTAVALWLKENEPRPYLYVCTPTGDELPEMADHWNRLEDLLQSPLLKIRADLDLNGLIKDQDALPNHRMRFCTPYLKLEPYQKLLRDNTPAVSYVGLRADEEKRTGTIFGDLENVEQRFPLRELGWGAADVWKYLDDKGVCIPRRTDCARCYEQRLTEWRNLWSDYPEIYADAEAQEKRFGHTFRSPTRDTWPASMEGMRLRFEKGDIPRQRKKDKERSCRACSL